MKVSVFFIFNFFCFLSFSQSVQEIDKKQHSLGIFSEGEFSYPIRFGLGVDYSRTISDKNNLRIHFSHNWVNESDADFSFVPPATLLEEWTRTYEVGSSVEFYTNKNNDGLFLEPGLSLYCSRPLC